MANIAFGWNKTQDALMSANKGGFNGMMQQGLKAFGFAAAAIIISPAIFIICTQTIHDGLILNR